MACLGIMERLGEKPATYYDRMSRPLFIPWASDDIPVPKRVIIEFIEGLLDKKSMGVLVWIKECLRGLHSNDVLYPIYIKKILDGYQRSVRFACMQGVVDGQPPKIPEDVLVGIEVITCVMAEFWQYPHMY